MARNLHYIAVQTLGTFFWGKVINQSVYQGKLYAPVTKRGPYYGSDTKDDLFIHLGLYVRLKVLGN